LGEKAYYIDFGMAETGYGRSSTWTKTFSMENDVDYFQQPSFL